LTFNCDALSGISYSLPTSGTILQGYGARSETLKLALPSGRLGVRVTHHTHTGIMRYSEDATTMYDVQAVLHSNATISATPFRSKIERRELIKMKLL